MLYIETIQVVSFSNFITSVTFILIDSCSLINDQRVNSTVACFYNQLISFLTTVINLRVILIRETSCHFFNSITRLDHSLLKICPSDKCLKAWPVSRITRRKTKIRPARRTFETETDELETKRLRKLRIAFWTDIYVATEGSWRK